jgi:hypothetical protein
MACCSGPRGARCGLPRSRQWSAELLVASKNRNPHTGRQHPRSECMQAPCHHTWSKSVQVGRGQRRACTESLRFRQRAQARTRRRTLVRFCMANVERLASVPQRRSCHGVDEGWLVFWNEGRDAGMCGGGRTVSGHAGCSLQVAGVIASVLGRPRHPLPLRVSAQASHRLSDHCR